MQEVNALERGTLVPAQMQEARLEMGPPRLSLSEEVPAEGV